MLISPAGEFRLEKGLAINAGRKKAKVFIASLSSEQMESLRALLSRPQILSLNTPSKPGVSYGVPTRDADIFAAQIPRGEKIQSIYFIQDDYHSKWPPGLKDIEKWFLKVSGQKLVEDKTKQPNNCAAL